MIVLGFCICSGQDHIVTRHRTAVATLQLENPLQILAFMGFGLITKMVHTHLTVIQTIVFSHLRYFILRQFSYVFLGVK